MTNDKAQMTAIIDHIYIREFTAVIGINPWQVLCETGSILLIIIITEPWCDLSETNCGARGMHSSSYRNQPTRERERERHRNVNLSKPEHTLHNEHSGFVLSSQLALHAINTKLYWCICGVYRFYWANKVLHNNMPSLVLYLALILKAQNIAFYILNTVYRRHRFHVAELTNSFNKQLKHVYLTARVISNFSLWFYFRLFSFKRRWTYLYN